MSPPAAWELSESEIDAASGKASNQWAPELVSGRSLTGPVGADQVELPQGDRRAETGPRRRRMFFGTLASWRRKSGVGCFSPRAGAAALAYYTSPTSTSSCHAVRVAVINSP